MKKLWLVLICTGLAAVLAAGIYYYRHRYVRSDEDLLAILPGGDVTTLYVNVAALRDSGMLKLLTGTRVPLDKEYAKFVRDINFDYVRDLDRLVGAMDGDQVYCLLRGRFDWEKLRRYPADHGGGCVRHTCRVPTGTPNRWVSFHLIQPDVLSLALSADTEAANILQPPAKPRPVSMPAEPVWIRVGDQLLRNPGALPLPLRIFAVSGAVGQPGRGLGGNCRRRKWISVQTCPRCRVPKRGYGRNDSKSAGDTNQDAAIGVEAGGPKTQRRGSDRSLNSGELSNRK